MLITALQKSKLAAKIEAAMMASCEIYARPITITASGGTQAHDPYIVYSGPCSWAPIRKSVSDNPESAARNEAVSIEVTLPASASVEMGNELRIGSDVYEVGVPINRQFTKQVSCVKR